MLTSWVSQIREHGYAAQIVVFSALLLAFIPFSDISWLKPIELKGELEELGESCLYVCDVRRFRNLCWHVYQNPHYLEKRCLEVRVTSVVICDWELVS